MQVLRPLILLVVGACVFAQQATQVIERRCLACHNAQARSGELVLSDRASALRGGTKGTALRPGSPDSSLMIERVERGEMPPGNRLPAEEIKLLRDWISSGAPWTGELSSRKKAGPDWWSLQPLPSAHKHATIDAFIRDKLQEKALGMSAPADQRTLIRRASFDLLGLPPSPEEVQAFLSDTGADAYERLIDRLLASPHYGERWGRHWLDVARFGESNGYEQNHIRERAWPYRDWVIQSLNQDKSFREMTLEQLAGDQIAPGNGKIEAATGFLVAGIHDTVQIQNLDGEKQKRANDLDDFVVTTGAGFLGLTIGCARCHDHKFDPILQADYNRMAAVFAGVEHGEREIATAGQRAARREKEEPLRKELDAVKARIADIKEKAKPEMEARRAGIVAGLRPPVDSKLTEERFAARPARYVRLRITATYRRSTPSLDEVEVFEQSTGRNVALASAGAKVTASSTRSTGTGDSFYQPEHVIDGGFGKHWISAENNTGELTIELAAEHSIDRVAWSRDRLGAFQGRFLSQVPTEYVLESSRDGRSWEKVADSADRLPYGETEQQDFILGRVLTDSELDRWRGLEARQKELERELARLPKFPSIYAGRFSQPKESGEAGSPKVLERLLPGFTLDASAPEPERRLALARWLTDDRNTLTARVLANRVWHYHFGRGIAGTPSDFGFNGEKPINPELLDFLAGRLIAHGWRLKPLHREIMLSEAYRQSSAYSEKAAAVDSEAKWLWRFPPHRLDGEALRDTMLAVSGKLDTKMGGPGFRLYKYTVDNVATYLPLENPGEETYRRAVYHQWARSVKDDMLSIHDCPDSALAEPKRTATTTPLQALSLLNSNFALDQARFLAARLEREAGTDRRRQIERAFALAYNRAPQPEEISEALAFLEHNSLELFCRVLYNSNEFAYVF
jgi:hypothetical protein